MERSGKVGFYQIPDCLKIEIVRVGLINQDWLWIKKIINMFSCSMVNQKY